MGQTKSLISTPSSKDIPSLAKFFEQGAVTTYSRNDWICGSDQGPCNDLHFIKQGIVKAYTETEREHIHIVLDSNEIFPLLLLSYAGDSRVKYAALNRVKIYSINSDLVKEKLETDIEFANHFLQLTLHQYRLHADRIDNLEYKDAYQRVITRIIFLVARFSTIDNTGNYSVDKVFTHQVIANTLNLTRESVSRVILILQQKGFLHYDRGYLIVTDVKAMAKELDDPVSNCVWGLDKCKK